MSAKRSDAKLYEKFKVGAPEMLAQIIQLLAFCRKLGIHVPRGVKNLFEFTWEELTVTTQRKAVTGEYYPVVHFVPTMESSFSSTTYKSHAVRKSITRGTLSEPCYMSPSAENQQILLKFQRRSVHLLSELLKLKMKAMIDSVTGRSSEEVTRKFLEAGQLLCPKNQEEAAELMAPKKKVSHLKTIPISSTIQLIHQVSVSCLSFSLASKENKPPKAPGSSKFKPVQEVINFDHQHDPCPEARQKLREMCRFICSLALMMDLEGGAVWDRDGYLTHKWSWSSKTQILQSLEFQINEELKLKVLGENSITLSFSCLNETINMSLSRAPCTHPPKADKREFAKANDSEEKEQQLKRALEEIKKRFQKTVKQFINAILIASGIIPIEYPVLAEAKHVKFKMKPPPSQTWAKRAKEECFPIASETKRPQKPPRRPADRRVPSKPSSRLVDQRRPSSYLDTVTQPKPAPRVKTVSAADAHPPRTWASSTADCPIVLRRLLSKQDSGLGCKCVVKIPFVTDLEFDKFISAPRKSDQILVIFVLSSQNPSYSPFLEWMLQSLYMEEQHGRPSPCIQCRHDPYRLLRYDMDRVIRQKPPLPPLLVRKHAVTPGMVLMYAGGKLLFGGSVFNGYGCSKKDLLKQISQARLDCKMGHFLPESFKFSAIPVEDPDQDKLKNEEDSVEKSSEEPLSVPKGENASRSKLKLLRTLTAIKCIRSMQEQKQKKNQKSQIAQAKGNRKNSETSK
nr:uncharacterized protein C3orf20 homolog isoform X5 [Pelodiscus sinensis]|eukprot:XP_025045336.1 uncharacterized protein C3orf20 homolog isoform X5 [Pelodiscus sinensis]